MKIQKREDEDLLSIPPPDISRSLSCISNHIVVNYIDHWYKDFDSFQSGEFQESVARSLKLAFIKMGVTMRETHATSLILMLVQTFLKHMV
jgi:hypothetical protein